MAELHADKLPRPLAELEQTLGYTFRDRSLLEVAMTHSSYANEMKGKGVILTDVGSAGEEGPGQHQGAF